VLAPGDVYPGDDTRPFYAEYDYGKGEVLSVDNAVLSYAPTSGMTTNTFTNAFRRALVQVENTSGSNITLTRFRITGDVTYRGDTNIVRSEDWSTSMKRLSVEAPLLQDMGQAQTLATGLKRYYQYSDFRYTLKSSDEFEPGDFIDVEDTNLGIDHRCVIIEQRVVDETTDNTIYEYVLEAIEEFVAETTAEESEHGPANDINEQIDNLPATSTILDLIDDGYINSGSATNPGTTVPAVPVVTAKSQLKSTVLEWDLQTNLTNFAKYQLQVSADAGSTWYSLNFDGLGIGTINELTDWYSALLVHPRLPLGGTDEEPTASTWHYRVRRVTKSGANSDWSTVVNAQALAVGNGDLAADSIYGNNIRANEVTADKIAVDVLNALVANINTNLTISDTLGYLASETEAEGAERAYLDPNEIVLQEYTGGAWADRIRLGSVDAAGDGKAFFGDLLRARSMESLYSSLPDTWSSLISNSHTSNRITSVVYGDGVWMAAGWDAEISRSTDSGATWSTLISTSHDAAAQINVGYGDGVWIIGDTSGNVSRSTDDGVTWSTLISTSHSAIRSVAYGGGVWVITGSLGEVSRSTDGGLTWSGLISNSHGSDAITRSAYGDGVWVMVGVGGKVSRSTDSGATWSTLISNSHSTTTMLSVGYGDGVWCVGDNNGKISRSLDGGATWSTLISNSHGTDGIVSLFHGNGVWVASGWNGKMSISADDGATWSSLITTSHGIRGILSTTYGDGVWVAGGVDSDISRCVLTIEYRDVGFGIVEQGSNSNGNYVVFSSGLQVCWGTTMLTVGLTVSSIGNYRNGGGTWTGSWPKAFGTTPLFLGIPEDANGSSISTVPAGTTATAWSILMWAGSSQASNSRTALLLAIGYSA
jgi:hypothetical protein